MASIGSSTRMPTSRPRDGIDGGPVAFRAVSVGYACWGLAHFFSQLGGVSDRFGAEAILKCRRRSTKVPPSKVNECSKKCDLRVGAPYLGVRSKGYTWRVIVYMLRNEVCRSPSRPFARICEVIAKKRVNYDRALADTPVASRAV